MQSPQEEQFRCYRFSNFTLQPDAGVLFQNGEPLPLRRKPYEVLLYLVSHAPRTISREELLREVWKGARHINVVDQCIHELRTRLGDSPKKPSFIQAVYGAGYRFIADVQIVSGNADEPDADEEPAGKEKTAVPDVRPALISRRMWLAIALVALPAGALLFWERRSASAGSAMRPPGIQVSGREIQALDPEGRILWRHPLPFLAATISPNEMSKRLWHLGPAPGRSGSARQILAAVPRAGASPEALAHALFCFTPSGALLWEYVPREVLEFPGRRFDGGWEVQKVLITASSVWVVVKHEIWWPSFVVRVEGGRPRLVLIHSGWLHDLAVIEASGKEIIAAAGVNNEFGAGALAILAPPYELAASPQTHGSPYQCLNGLAHPAEPYFLFPRTDLAAAENKPYSAARAARWHGSYLEVEVEEQKDYSSFYRFDERLSPVSYAVSDGYAERHEKLYRQHLLPHPASQCGELTHSRKLRLFIHGRWTQPAVPRALDSQPSPRRLP